jgi:hypothetical protein
MDSRCYVGLSITAIVLFGLFVLPGMLPGDDIQLTNDGSPPSDESQGVSVNAVITHYDTEGNPITIEERPWWEGIFSGAFTQNNADIQSQWDATWSYAVSATAISDLNVDVHVEVTVIMQKTTQSGAWGDYDSWTATEDSTHTEYEQSRTDTFDYNQIIQNLDEEARYIIQYDVEIDASAISTDSGETLSATWIPDTLQWTINWHSDSTMDITGDISVN